MKENPFLMSTLEVLAILFVTGLVISIVFFIIIYIIDRNQTVHAIRRNYPVIGRFRYWFEHLGTFFRQYFFTMDREELPFNRAERSWVYRAAKNISNTVAFGSTRDLKPAGTVIFVNCPFPTLGKDAVKAREVTIGEACQQPYTTASIFNISGMSFGALSKPAVISLSHGARKAGAWINTGEGGLSPYHLDGGADIVFQIGTAKYGVRDEHGELSDEKLREVAAHEQVKMFEIKLSQGAKPGKGGILPGTKVTAEIAAIRGIPEGEDSISPNRHTDINSNGDLLDMIQRIRSITGKPVGFKVVIGTSDWIDDLCKLILQRGVESAPDFIAIDSSTGGTGAAPMSLIDYVGLSIQESLPLVVDKLSKYQLRERIKIIASGKLITPAEVAWALCMGADFISSARGFMFALGCIQALQCDKNSCPTGITTHNKKLQRGLVHSQKSSRVTHYIENMIHEVGVIGHSCGVKSPRELNRSHARIVQSDGRSKSLETLYPNKN
ncbi:Ferredoxin-dependent glutamate synthase [hydrothermal vent metagenome]|uniref:Ferredoxin-dependent glutamate synthase n=1 Tax=hydrothermal vent metagenome TaxID=652676 RepID=A0A3B0YFM2_9ZZZZ